MPARKARNYKDDGAVRLLGICYLFRVSPGRTGVSRGRSVLAVIPTDPALSRHRPNSPSHAPAARPPGAASCRSFERSPALFSALRPHALVERKRAPSRRKVSKTLGRKSKVLVLQRPHLI